MTRDLPPDPDLAALDELRLALPAGPFYKTIGGWGWLGGELLIDG